MKNRLILPFISAFLISCASTPKVYTDFDPKQDFSEYKTFSWVTNSPALVEGDYSVSALTKSRMTQAIKDKLVAMGYEFIENPKLADFTLIYTIGARDKIRINQYPVHRRYYSGHYSRTWGGYYYRYFDEVDYGQVADDYVRGEIAIDIFDGKTRQGVWHASLSKRLTSKQLQSNGENAPLVIDALFAEFPPPKKL